MYFVAIFAILISFYSSATFAADSSSMSPTDTLPEITVVDSRAVTTAGKSVLGREIIQALPQGDGAITDLLKVLPGIQFSETQNSSLTGGEILPAEISISGGRVYDNNFMIDGVGNNSLIDPASSNPASITDVPGHSQELFLDSSLLESVIVRRSNISARYDDFTGGVTQMKTRNPAKEFGGVVGYRTTRSEWTSFHVEREDRDDFENSDDYHNEPCFRKQYGHFSLDIPLNEKMGLLVAYSQEYSKIPLSLLGETENQYRKQENLFVKYRFQPNDKTDFKLTALWTPYEGEYFINNTRNSNYTVEGGGVSLNANLNKIFDFGKIETIVGWRKSEENRCAHNGFYSWALDGEGTNWGNGFANFSQEGGYGDIDNEQESFTVQMHVTFEPFKFAGLEHSFIAGLSYERTKIDYRRYDTTSLTKWTANDAVVCTADDEYCKAGDQYAYWQKIYAQENSSAEITLYDFYLEDSMSIKNITFRPGLHVSYNDLMENTDYAARNAVFYDVFHNGSTVLKFGANRYYGKTFLTSALRDQEQGSPVYDRGKHRIKDLVTGKFVTVYTLQDDNSPEPWKDKTSIQRGMRLSQLRTPYSDEWTVGVEQALLGGSLSIAYIDRNNEDEIAKSRVDTDGGKFYELNNNGESRHKEVTLSWERQWQKHYLLIDATWQDSTTSNEDYNTTLEDADRDDEVCYHGKLMDKIDLPKSDYNREWSANLVYRATLPYGFAFTNILRYRSGYAAIVDTQENYDPPVGEKIDIYDDVSYPSSTTFDGKLEWVYSITATQSMTITADVTNVFNKKLYTGTEGEYEMGRQLWVGLDYAF